MRLTRGDLPGSARAAVARRTKGRRAMARQKSEDRDSTGRPSKGGPNPRRRAPRGREGGPGRRTDGAARTALRDSRKSASEAERADGGADAGRPAPATRAAPKSKRKEKRAASATMEEVAKRLDEKRSQKVASNKGAPGPDRQSIDEVREHLDELLPALSRALLEGTLSARRNPAGVDPEGGRRAARAWDSRTWSTGWCRRPCGRCSNRCTSRRSMRRATGFDRDEAATRRSPRPRGIWRTATSGWWISIWRSSSTGSTTSG